MKKKLAGLCAALVAVLFITSCVLTESQVQVVAQNAGMGAAVGWIAQSNPEREAMNLVSSALDLVQSNITEVAVGDSNYTSVMYPKIVKFTQSDVVPDQYEPLVLAGSMALLNGIDILFVMNPEWKEKEGVTLGIVNSFVIGAKTGLALADNDTRLIKARALAVTRTKLYQP